MQQALLASRHALGARTIRHACRTSSRSLRATAFHLFKHDLSDLITRPSDTQPSLPPVLGATTRASRPLESLPLTCPGCGAPSQNVDSDAPGYFGQKNVRDRSERKKRQDAIFAGAMSRQEIREDATALSKEAITSSIPVCDRCHTLMHQSAGRPIVHPTTESIRAIIEDSPHHRNHIYHVIDAADFPMSLIPNLTSALHLPKLRTQNRRAKNTRYIRDRVAEISFIITRSDLLAPKKEQVDKMMAYVQEVLREALGRTGKNVRLGNVHMVSSKRGWWTKSLKEDIYERGGAGWMVGKVNVGKSALVEVVFPKGRMDDAIPVATRTAEDAVSDRLRSGGTTFRPISNPEHNAAEDLAAQLPIEPYEGHDMPPIFGEDHIDPAAVPSESVESYNAQSVGTKVQPSDVKTELDSAATTPIEQTEDKAFLFDESGNSLLPPAPTEVAYPVMPTVSSLPGTTASPIRLPFGRGRGELIDLPGVERTQLDEYVKEDVRKDLVMKSRLAPEQQSVKPGQSLLLGGLIRITPKTDDMVFLMYSFLPSALNAHITSTDKAIAIQTGKFADTDETYAGGVTINATEAARTMIASAGTFKLNYDVTRVRAGPVTHKAAGKMKPERLPYIVYSLDILVEGVGWVEIVAQMRRKAISSALAAHDPFDDGTSEPDSHFPEVEVFSPKGRFIGSRRPLNAWMTGGPKKTPVHAQKPRPRKSISYQKRVAGGGIGVHRVQEHAVIS